MTNDFLTDDTKAIILLCGVFGRNRSDKPLTQAEYTSLVHCLINAKIRPGDLLQKDHIADASIGTGIARHRLESLLGRGVQLGFAVEEWQRNGIWIISRSDTDYPARYKKHLKDKAPPLLFGVGERSLLTGGGLAIIGSRNVDKEGEAFTRHTAELCAFNRMPVVSGGARGVDQFAMTATLEAGGVTIGIVAENLLKKSLERSARHAIADGRLLLLSPYHPKARFTVGTAMARNKLIYAMADYGLVVSAEHKKGGTWAGAQEELKRDVSMPVFVRVGNNTPLGNSKLINLGAIAWPEVADRNNLKQQLTELSTKTQEKKKQTAKNLSLFDFQPMKETIAVEEQQKKVVETINDAKPAIEAESKTEECLDSTYQAVLPVILNKIESPATSEELAESLDVVKKQLNSWLKKAISEGIIRKLSRPVRYEKA
jgi:predicted Rossmann fold nucleotide-binding protein DprA/Smf involved in DNA uptake